MRSLHHLPRTAVIAVAMVGSVGLVAGGTTAATAAQRPSRVTVANAQPRLARATSAGAPSSSQLIDVKLYLADQHADELDAAVAAVSTPGTAQYAKYLTAAQFRARYAPSAATVAAVRKFITDSGLSVGAIPANRSYVSARGSVANVQKAFGTSLKQYKLDGRTIRAAATATTIPASLQGKVIALSGLASATTLMKPNHEDGPKVKSTTAKGSTAAQTGAARKSSGAAPPPDAFVNAKPCSTYFGQKIDKKDPKAYGKAQPYAPCGYIPAQLQGAYGLKSSLKKGITGKGVTVAITDAYAAPTILADANTYAKKHGQKPFAKGQFKQVLPSAFTDGFDGDNSCDEQGWYGEETLDVEAVHATAPGAKVTYVASASCNNDDFADTLNKVVDGHLADIVTNSWGGTDETNGTPELEQVYQNIFVQAVLQGIGMYFSSGDSGDGAIDNNDVPTAQAPANNSLVTAVGGTTLAVSKKNTRTYETGWSTAKSSLVDGKYAPKPPGDFLYGGGGGTSKVFKQPFYQRGVVPTALSHRYSSKPGRVVPDISALGDPSTGMLVGETQTFPDGTVKYSEYRIGGTSLASPLFAGMMALADQKAGFAHGFANPAFYQLYKTKAFYDPKAVSNRGVVRVDFINGVNAADGLVRSLRSIDVTTGNTLRTTKGYDDVTGVGSPNGASFLSALMR